MQAQRNVQQRKRKERQRERQGEGKGNKVERKTDGDARERKKNWKKEVFSKLIIHFTVKYDDELKMCCCNQIASSFFADEIDCFSIDRNEREYWFEKWLANKTRIDWTRRPGYYRGCNALMMMPFFGPPIFLAISPSTIVTASSSTKPFGYQTTISRKYNFVSPTNWFSAIFLILLFFGRKKGNYYCLLLFFIRR